MVSFAVRRLVPSLSAAGIIFAAGQAGVPLAESDVAAAAICLAAGALWTLYGSLMEVVVAVHRFVRG